MTKAELDNLFSYHPPKGTQVQRYTEIREAGKALATVILECTPECGDRNAAVHKVRQAIMLANCAIACNE